MLVWGKLKFGVLLVGMLDNVIIVGIVQQFFSKVRLFCELVVLFLGVFKRIEIKELGVCIYKFFNSGVYSSFKVKGV